MTATRHQPRVRPGRLLALVLYLAAAIALPLTHRHALPGPVDVASAADDDGGPGQHSGELCSACSTMAASITPGRTGELVPPVIRATPHAPLAIVLASTFSHSSTRSRAPPRA